MEYLVYADNQYYVSVTKVFQLNIHKLVWA